MSRPLSVNQSSPVPGCQSKPTVLRCRGPRSRSPFGTPLGINPGDGRIDGVLGIADVARRAHRHVELAVRAEADELPAVVAVERVGVGDHHRLRRARQMVVDGVEAQHAGDLGHVERAVAPGDTVGRAQPRGQGEDLVGPPVLVLVHQGVDLPLPHGAYVDDPPRRLRQRPRARHRVGVHRDGKPRRQLDAVELRLARRGAGEGGEEQQGRRGAGEFWILDFGFWTLGSHLVPPVSSGRKNHAPSPIQNPKSQI